MEFMDVEKLMPHSKNRYFFDDMDGEPWTAFLESIETSGIIEPIIATAKDLTIVSGHQRVRAAKKLGIKQVAVEVRHYDSEDEVLKQLIETNIRQRGVGNTNPIKFGRCLKELDRIYGVRSGSAGKVARGIEVQNALPKTQQDIATEIGISVDQYKRYEALTNLIPEIADMVDNGLTMTSAVAIARKLSPEEQRQLAEQISGKEKVSQREIDFYTRRIKELSDENNALKARKPEVKEIVKEVEVVPDDYDSLKKKAKQADAYRKDFDNERQKTADERRKNLELQDRIAELEQRSASGELHTRVVEGSLMFISGCGGFLRDYGGYVWIAEHLNELNQTEQDNYKKAVESVYAWSQNLLEAIKRERSMNNE